jgi:hypothetical protein
MVIAVSDVIAFLGWPIASFVVHVAVGTAEAVHLKSFLAYLAPVRGEVFSPV